MNRTPNELYKISLEYFKNRMVKNLANDNTQDDYKNKILSMTKILDGYNIYLLLCEGYEDRILDDLLKKSLSMERFIIEETSLYIRNCFNNETEIFELLKIVASSFATLSGEVGAIHRKLSNPLPSYDEAIESLNNNIWLLTLILMRDALDEKL